MCIFTDRRTVRQTGSDKDSDVAKEALPSSANVQSRHTSSFADDDNAS